MSVGLKEKPTRDRVPLHILLALNLLHDLGSKEPKLTGTQQRQDMRGWEGDERLEEQRQKERRMMESTLEWCCWALNARWVSEVLQAFAQGISYLSLFFILYSKPYRYDFFGAKGVFVYVCLSSSEYFTCCERLPIQYDGIWLKQIVAHFKGTMLQGLKKRLLEIDFYSSLMRNARIVVDNYKLNWKESRNDERAELTNIKYKLNHGTFLSKEIKLFKKEICILLQRNYVRVTA